MNQVTTAVQSDVLNYIIASFDTITADAQAGYQNEGRGAVVIDLRHSPQVSGYYLSLSRILIEVGPLPDDRAGEYLLTYNPTSELVVLTKLPGDRVLLFKFAFETE
ncbi:MAG: hypothetical protein AAF485_01020 [Chloroflexota bacterium]